MSRSTTGAPHPVLWLADAGGSSIGLGEQIISDLIRDIGVGATQRTLAEGYGISLSSVKRLSRRPRSDSFEPTIRWEAGRKYSQGSGQLGMRILKAGRLASVGCVAALAARG